MATEAQYDTSAEQAVIGSVLVSSECYPSVAPLLDKDDFYRGSHRYIWSAIQEAYQRDPAFDSIAVAAVLRERKQLETVGGLPALTDIAMAVTGTASIKWHAQQVRRLALLRRIQRKLAEAGEAAAASDANPEAILFAVASHVEGFRSELQVEAGSSLPLVLERTWNLIEQRHARKGEVSGVPTGFYEIDALTSGFQSGQLAIIAGRPSMGKTALALNIAQNCATRFKQRVAVFSLEMSDTELGERLLSRQSRVSSGKLRSGFLDGADWDSIGIAMGELSTAPLDLFFLSDGISTFVQLEAKLRGLVCSERAPELVIVDYLQLLSRSQEAQSGANRAQEIGDITRGLKRLAGELQIPVIVLSQLSRAVETRQEKRPMLGDLRDSGSIEQDADIVMFVYRDEYYNPDSIYAGEAEIIVAKQRCGPTGTVALRFQNDCCSFWDLSPENLQQREQRRLEGARKDADTYEKSSGGRAGRATERNRYAGGAGASHAIRFDP